MFDVSWGEMFLIGAVALVVIGPKELPGVLRATGQGLAKLRRMAADFQYQFQQALQEAELDKVKDQVSGLTDTAKAGFDPVGYARDQIKSAIDDVKPAGKPVDIGPPSGPATTLADLPVPEPAYISPEALAAQLAPAPVEAAKPKRKAKVVVAEPVAPLAVEPTDPVAKLVAKPKAPAVKSAAPKTKAAKSVVAAVKPATASKSVTVKTVVAKPVAAAKPAKPAGTKTARAKTKTEGPAA
jgi:sec-independent protein translocase protein TatB